MENKLNVRLIIIGIVTLTVGSTIPLSTEMSSILPLAIAYLFVFVLPLYITKFDKKIRKRILTVIYSILLTTASILYFKSLSCTGWNCSSFFFAAAVLSIEILFGLLGFTIFYFTFYYARQKLFVAKIFLGASIILSLTFLFLFALESAYSGNL